MQNKTFDQGISTPGQNFDHLGPVDSEHIISLEARIKTLSDICNELNPYSPVTEDFKKRLREFNIMEFEDPFKITNALLRLLEDSIEELHQLRPLSPEELLKENLR